MIVRISDIVMQMDCDDDDFFKYRLRDYGYNGSEKVDMTIKSKIYDSIPVPCGTVIEQIKNAVIMDMENNRYCRYVRSAKTDAILFAVYYHQDYTNVEIQLLKTRNHPIFSLTDFEYMYTGEMFSDRLTYLGGLVLHGSAIAYHNQGIVFSAPSGTGKSTHTGLWMDKFGKDVTIINDDKPAIRFYDGVPFLMGTPWSGKTDLNTNTKAPLKAIVFIERATANSIKRLNVAESVYYLTSQTVRPYYDANIGKKTLDVIEKLIQTTPIYQLSCNISEEAVQIVYQEIIEKDEEYEN